VIPGEIPMNISRCKPVRNPICCCGKTTKNFFWGFTQVSKFVAQNLFPCEMKFSGIKRLDTTTLRKKFSHEEYNYWTSKCPLLNYPCGKKVNPQIGEKLEHSFFGKKIPSRLNPNLKPILNFWVQPCGNFWS